MSIRSQIRPHLVGGRKTVEQLAELTGLPHKTVISNMGPLKHEGRVTCTYVDNVAHYGLGKWPDKAGADAPPQPRKTKKPAKKRAAKPPRKTKKTKPAKPPPAAQVDSAFIPAMTIDNRLVLIGRDPAPQIFTPGHTQDIATLLLDRFDPA